MNYATIKFNDIANGPGVRISLFVSGCRHHCKNCFNKEAWDFDYGKKYTQETQDRILSALSPDYVSGLSLLGGEPFEPENQSTLLSLLKATKEKYPQKDIWCYTGSDFEKDILSGKCSHTALDMLKYIDVIVDGKFIEEKKNLRLIFRGSENQNIIDVKKSLENNKTVLLDGVWERQSGLQL